MGGLIENFGLGVGAFDFPLGETGTKKSMDTWHPLTGMRSVHHPSCHLISEIREGYIKSVINAVCFCA